MKSCAIVILNYNGEEMLRQFLPSVLEYSQSDIWVIDNASTDQSIEVLKKDFPDIQLITLQENFGFAGGYNHGLEFLKNQYKYYILLNSDVEVTLDWDLNLVSHASENPDYAAFQPKILSFQNPDQFDYAGAGGGFIDSLGYPYCRGRIWEHVEKDSGQYDDNTDIDWATGACCIIKSELYHKFKGFDSHFFAHMEEIDLCWRMRNEGWKIGYLGSVKVYHVGGATLSRTSPKKLFLNIRNSLSMIYKNESHFAFVLKFISKFCLEMMAAVSFVLRGDSQNAKAVFKGYREFLFSKSYSEDQISKLGRKHTSYTKGPVSFLIYHTGILRKKYFSEL